VFNTAITGYQEVLTDPSYRGQIVLMTAPEIGNVGVNPEDFESARPFCAGFVVRDLSPRVSTGAPGSLHGLMAEYGVAGITGIDTRAVTRRVRIGGAQRALITRQVDDPAAAVARARSHPSLEGRDLVVEVTSREPYEWSEGLWTPPAAGIRPRPAATTSWPTTSVSSGASCGRLRHSGCRVTVVPAQTSAKEVMALKPDGVFLSNGPATRRRSATPSTV
jgi:carbamoyl-phosphate synthase small subunit